MRWEKWYVPSFAFTSILPFSAEAPAYLFSGDTGCLHTCTHTSQFRSTR